jgi:hypothetical protein
MLYRSVAMLALLIGFHLESSIQIQPLDIEELSPKEVLRLQDLLDVAVLMAGHLYLLRSYPIWLRTHLKHTTLG